MQDYELAAFLGDTWRLSDPPVSLLLRGSKTMDTDSIILTVWFGVTVLAALAAMASIVLRLFSNDPTARWWPTWVLVALAAVNATVYVSVGGTVVVGDLVCWGQCTAGSLTETVGG